MTELLTTDKINLHELFNNDTPIVVKKYQYVNGKKKYVATTIKESELDSDFIFRCQLLIAFILFRQFKKTTNRFVMISKNTLQKLLGVRYHQYVEILEKKNVIRIGHNYKQGVVCKVYCIGTPFFGKINSVSVEKDYDTKFFSIYDDGYIIRNKVRVGALSDTLKYHTDTNEDIYKRYSTELVEYLQRNHDILVGGGYVSGSLKCNRIFSKVSNLEKVKRKELQYNGKNFKEVDFTASHIQHLIKICEDNGIECDELKDHFLSDTDFYDNYCMHLTLSGIKGCSRDKVKTHVQYWLTNAYRNRAGVDGLFQRYPTITPMIEDIPVKSRESLINTLMRSEAYLVNSIILGRMSQEWKDSICIPIFDAILVDEDHAERLLAIATEEANKYFNFQTKIKIK